jgi:hypothetical protein
MKQRRGGKNSFVEKAEYPILLGKDSDRNDGKTDENNPRVPTGSQFKFGTP